MNSKTNPYILQFGKEPAEIIPRVSQITEIENAFFDKNITQQIFMITGVRGSGKTVFMSSIASDCLKKNWIVVNVNVSSANDILSQIAIELSHDARIQKKHEFKNISISVGGFSLGIAKKEPITSYEYETKQLLKIAKKYHYRVLITMDEVTNSAAVREFSGAFQIWVREELPVYLLMTGLYENIHELQNVKTLTFLYRAPRIDLDPLSLYEVKENYQSNLNISEEESIQMAKMTNGYSFAFQVLGHEVWKNKKFNEDAIKRYRYTLWNLSYDKIWNDLSDNDRKVCLAIAQSKDGKFSTIKEILNWNNNQLNPYRKRLINKQVLKSVRTGYVAFVLPLFDEYVLNSEMFE